MNVGSGFEAAWERDFEIACEGSSKSLRAWIGGFV